MQESVIEILESSRWNSCSWLLPAVLILGAVALILISRIRQTWLRLPCQTLLALGLTYAAIEASFLDIQEKWQIRHDWSRKHWDELSEQERRIFISDGANLVFGPLFKGGSAALLIFGCALLAGGHLRRRLAAAAVPAPTENPTP
ncbi:MAG: hypothetical protein RL095_1292 [Verrucomicrobiota bacterium]|jgi:hypothetical protein